MISKACVVGTYQRKLEELARCPNLELAVVVPPYWREAKRVLRLEKLCTSGYELHVLPMALNGCFHLHFYLGLGAVLSSFRPDIVHIDEEPYNLATFQAMRLARSHGARALFFTWQNLPRSYPFPFRSFERYNYERAAFAIAGNQEASTVLRGKGYHGRIRVLPQFGVDPDLYHRLESTPRRRETFVIGYAGRLVEEKGVQILLQAVAALHGEWTLWVVGDGPYLPSLKALCGELDLQRRVCFKPPVPSWEMPQILNQLDALVLPSLTRRHWKEQFGRILVEGMACEVAVVGSSCGEIPHLIADAGLVFPEGDAAALREALRRLMHDPQLRLQLGQRGREHVLQHYTQQRIAADTYDVYREIQAE